MQPLSRDHLIALMGAQRLQKVSEHKITWNEGVTFFLSVWRHEVCQHLEDEERILPEFIKDPLDLERLLSDHRQLREFASWIEAAAEKEEPDLELARNAGNFLDSHVRWEEREFFPRIETTNSSSEIERLQALTAEVEAGRERGRSCRPT